MTIFKNYRHIICISITVILFALGIFVFNGCAWRFIESCGDFGTSFAYSVLDLFDLSDKVTLSFLKLPQKAPWADKFYTHTPKLFLPETWEKFGEFMNRYWKTFINWKTIVSYLLFILQIILNVTTFAYYFFLLFVLMKKIFKKYLHKQNKKKDDEDIF